MNPKEIKDAARQAFRDQQTQDTEGGVPDAVSFCAGFLAGARHLQNAYETLNAHDEMLVATVEKLEEENKKLVEALKFYGNETSWNDISGNCLSNVISGRDVEHIIGDSIIGGKLARQVLKEIGEE